jgi:outer membrane protein assembly factor BamA
MHLLPSKSLVMGRLSVLAICPFYLVVLIASSPSVAVSKALEVSMGGLKGLTLDNYNRVDGLPISYGLHGRSTRFDFALRAIYRIASERVGWRGELTARIMQDGDLRLGVETHSFSDTNDRWRVGDFENSLSSILFKEDFRNYFQRQGVSFFLSGRLEPVLRGGMEYRYDRYSSLSTVADFSLFGWGKTFRPNPEVSEGWMGSVRFNMELDSRNARENPTTGWYQSLSYEISDPALGGDFGFQYADITVYRFNRIAPGGNLDMKFRAALGSGGAPPQRGIHIYGVGGLRGYPDDFTPHRSAFVAGIEARFTLAGRFRHVPLYRDRVKVLIFADAGKVQDSGSGRIPGLKATSVSVSRAQACSRTAAFSLHGG